MKIFRLTLAILCLASWSTAGQAPEPPLRLALEDAALMARGQTAPLDIRPDVLGPGRNAIRLPAGGIPAAEARWRVGPDVHGAYHAALPVLGAGFFEPSERAGGDLRLVVNATPHSWSGADFPVRLETGSPPARYAVRLWSRGPVHLSPGDVIAIRHNGGGQRYFGALELHPVAPAKLAFPFFDSPATPERAIRPIITWGEATVSPETIVQPVTIENRDALAHEMTLRAGARDARLRVLLQEEETVTLSPGDALTRRYAFAPGQGDYARLVLDAGAAGAAHPSLSRARYFTRDVLAGPRPRINLSGVWQFLPVQGSALGPPPTPHGPHWRDITVPSLQSNTVHHAAWYRREIPPSPALNGDRFVLVFNQVYSEATIVVNGELVHTQFDAVEPFEADISSAFRPGESNEILVGVRDWIAYSPRNQGRLDRGEPRVQKDDMQAPSGYLASGTWGPALGIGQEVWIEARPAVAVEDLDLTPSVRENTLSVRVAVGNRSDARRETRVRIAVTEDGREVLRFPEARVTLQPDRREMVTHVQDWPEARLWSPDDPHLYLLEIEVIPDAGATDRMEQRFGFRELWIDGIRFVLNGKPIKIRSSWAGADHACHFARSGMNRADRLSAIWDWHRAAMWQRGVQLSRTHNEVGVREVCDVADETGLMLKIENGSMCQQVFTTNETFWENMIASQLRMIQAYKNHAAVLMWSAGNENMWGWYYQGEQVRRIANAWQVRAARAMRASDPQQRLVEWEADGDLLGRWDYHQLHYPRELSAAPNLPVGAWWGPLDGRTVVPYSMGPVTLGEKPLTVGESFWVDMIRLPHGASILLGDTAFLGASQHRRAWYEASQYLLNGMRDAEFALIDTYVPLWMLKPRTLVFKEETRAFYGGRRLRREINVHHDVRGRSSLTLRWGLTSATDGEPLAGDARTFDVEPAELRREIVEVDLPPVDRILRAVWQVELLEGDTRIHVEQRPWTIHPGPRLVAPPALDLALYDPRGATAEWLREMKVPFRTVDGPDPDGCRALLIGSGALEAAAGGPWRERLQAFVRDGGRIAVLDHAVLPEALPVTALQARASRSTIGFVRAPHHPMLAGLRDEDLRWWADDHEISRGNFRKPMRGNWLPLIDTGSMDGLMETPLLEVFEGRGSWIFSQLRLVDPVRSAPAAGRLWQNLLDYLAAPAPARRPGRALVLAGEDAALRETLVQAGLQFDEPESLADPEPDTRPLIVVAASRLDRSLAAALRDAAHGGARVLVHNAGPDHAEAVADLLGNPVEWVAAETEPRAVQNRVVLRSRSPVVDGVSNQDLFWLTNARLQQLRRHGRWRSDLGPVPEAERLAEWFLVPTDEPTHWEWPTAPAVLLHVAHGAGHIVLNQLRLDRPEPGVVPTARRLLGLLLTNLDGALVGTGDVMNHRARRLASYQYHPVDLGPWANRGARDDPERGIVGWTNQGENDVRELPMGENLFGGVPFRISKPHVAIVLRSVSGMGNDDLPESVGGIPVGRAADALFFMHASAYTGGSSELFRYQVRYDDGTVEIIPIMMGRHIADWWTNPVTVTDALAAANAFTAWRGDNPMREGVTLFGYEWINPHPERIIRSLEARVAPDRGARGIPIWVGLTVAVRAPDTGVVEDVMGTAGLRVRVGDRLEDFYYIGVTGLAETHPYHAEAVAAHRAQVRNRTVTVDDGGSGDDGSGPRWVYVYAGDAVGDERDLLNAAVLGEGWGRLGPFRGADRHRVYMENLAFIASQRKAGLWAVDDRSD